MKSELRKGLEGNTEIPYSNNGNNSSGASNCTFASQFPRFACHGGSNVEGQWKQDYQSRGGSGSFDFGWGLLEVTFQFSQLDIRVWNGESVINIWTCFFLGGNLKQIQVLARLHCHKRGTWMQSVQMLRFHGIFHRFRQARSIKAELMEEEAEDSDDEEYQLLGINFSDLGMFEEKTWQSSYVVVQ